MLDQNKTELILAIIVSFLILSGLTMIGIWGFPSQPGEIAPIFPTLDHSIPLQRETGMGGADVRVQSDIGGSPAERPKVGTITMTPSASMPMTFTATPVRANGKTPTPVRVVVSTQKRSWVYFHGPATPVRSDAFAPLPLASFPRPANDNGRGLHWFPTTYQTRAVVDRFVGELTALKIRWLVILQGMHDWDMIANDYLIDRLNAEGIAIVMRIDRQVGPMDWGRLGWIVARYRERGVRYFQIFNEPNLDEEWGTAVATTPEQFVAYWIQGAEVVAANGGFPGFAPMSPQADDSDLAFFQIALEEVKRLKRYDLANLMWISIHNYGEFDRRDPNADGFFRYRAYDALVKKVFGGSLPMIVTEGGLADAEQMANTIAPMYQFVAKEREPFLLSFAPWLIGNAVGGGRDARWESAAWFTGTLSQVRARNVVEQVKGQ